MKRVIIGIFLLFIYVIYANGQEFYLPLGLKWEESIDAVKTKVIRNYNNGSVEFEPLEENIFYFREGGRLTFSLLFATVVENKDCIEELCKHDLPSDCYKFYYFGFHDNKLGQIEILKYNRRTRKLDSEFIFESKKLKELMEKESAN